MPGFFIAIADVTSSLIRQLDCRLITDNPNCPAHPAIMMVTAYVVERGLILSPYEVDHKTNEIKALPDMIEQLALKGVVFAFDAIKTQKNSTVDYRERQ